MSVLLHIGYHKTATSWLQSHLFKHPESPMRALGKSRTDAPSREIIITADLTGLDLAGFGWDA